MVDRFKDVITDFELMNEITDRPELQAEVPRNSGTDAAMYEDKPCYATLVAVLKGMTRAIADARTQSGLPLRIILGLSSRDWGFPNFLLGKGIRWDVTGFHIYPYYTHNSLLSDPWYGAGGPLAQLAKFGKPVHINEFNCNEIYDPKYRNQPGDMLFEQCMKSLDRHLSELRRQTIANIERIHIYELRDSQWFTGPESRFGLMYDLTRPKPHLYLATAFAGGELSAAERSQITSRGLFSERRATPESDAAWARR